MKLKNQKDFWAGILFAAFGIFFIIFAQENELGSASRMGPAYFPTLLGGILTFLGLACAVKGLFLSPNDGTDGRIPRPNLVILFSIMGSIAVFCLLLEWTGFLVAMALMVILCSAAGGEFRTKEVIVLVVILCALCWMIFVYLLGMTIPVIPPFLIGD